MGLMGILRLIRSRIVAVLLYSTGLASNLLLLSRVRISPLLFAGGVSAAISATVAAYILSDYLDLKEDRLNNPSRPLPSGRASVTDAKALIILSLMVALSVGFYINAATGVMVALSLVLSSLYSMPFIRGKEKYYTKSLLSWLGGFVGTFTASAILFRFSLLSFLVASVNGTMIMLLVMIGDIIDYEGDRASGVRSIAVTFGQEAALVLMELFLGLLAVFLLGIYYLASYIHPIYLITGLAGIVTTYYALIKLKSSEFDRRAAKMTKQVLRGLYFTIQASLILGILLSFVA
ncbi:MAG: UbiA prenyltransferase family protein [Nitrososphaeria archaeon]